MAACALSATRLTQMPGRQPAAAPVVRRCRLPIDSNSAPIGPMRIATLFVCGLLLGMSGSSGKSNDAAKATEPPTKEVGKDAKTVPPKKATPLHWERDPKATPPPR